MKTSIKKITFLLLAYFISVATISAKDVYIRQNASGTGVDWDNAANVSYLGGSSIADGDIIHIAAGDYLRTYTNLYLEVCYNHGRLLSNFLRNRFDQTRYCSKQNHF